MNNYFLEIRENLLGSVLIIIGFFISTFIFSISISFAKNYTYYYNEQNQFENNKYLTNIKLTSKSDTISLINDIYKSNSLNYIETSPIRYQQNENDLLINIIGVYYKNEKTLDLPIYKGRPLNKEDIFSNEKVAIIGTLLQEFIKTEDGTDYINIKGEKYKVIGIIGGENHSYFNNFMFIPLKEMPKFYLADSVIQSSFYTLKSENQDNFKKLKNDSKNIQFIDLLEISKSNAINDALYHNKNKFKSLYSDLFMATICIFVFSSIWIRGFYRTLCLSRLLGATTKNIFKKIFIHLGLLSFISLLLVFILQSFFKVYILNSLFYKYDYFLQLDISTSNILLTIVFLIVIAFLNSIFQVRKIIKLDIISNIK